MSNDLNRAMLVGRLGADPELKFTTGGQSVLRMRIATTESYADKGGDRKERTEWHNVVLWGKRAEALNKLLSKGSQVWIEGSIQTRSWEDKDGGKRYATEINARDVGLIGNRQGGQPRGYDGGGATNDDDIPFAPIGDVG